MVLASRPRLWEVGHDALDDPADTGVEAVDEAFQVGTIFRFPVAGFDAFHDGNLIG